jgi:hypothetical protein
VGFPARRDDAVRRLLIRHLLPLVFCLVPLLAAALILASLPGVAREFYLGHITPLDNLILGLGGVLFLIQIFLCWRGMQWRVSSFDERVDGWLSHLAQAAEWFPLLGLIGTVAGIMQTFSSFSGATVVTQSEVIARYAPAITATCSGLLMALINILPTWVVLIGRDLILALSGEAAPPKPAKHEGVSKDSGAGTRSRSESVRI